MTGRPIKYKKDMKMTLEHKNLKEDMIDFTVGFLVIPFFSFLFNVSILLVKNPRSITDGMSVLYIAFLSWFYYILSKEGIGDGALAYSVKDKPVFSKAKFFGMILFIILYASSIV